MAEMQFGDTCVFVTVEDVGSFLKIAGPGNFEIRIRLPSVEVANVIARAIESTKDAANSAQLPLSKPCENCGQTNVGQTGEFPCRACGLPMKWDN